MQTLENSLIDKDGFERTDALLISSLLRQSEYRFNKLNIETNFEPKSGSIILPDDDNLIDYLEVTPSQVKEIKVVFNGIRDALDPHLSKEQKSELAEIEQQLPEDGDKSSVAYSAVNDFGLRMGALLPRLSEPALKVLATALNSFHLNTSMAVRDFLDNLHPPAGNYYLESFEGHYGLSENRLQDYMERDPDKIIRYFGDRESYTITKFFVGKNNRNILPRYGRLIDTGPAILFRGGFNEDALELLMAQIEAKGWETVHISGTGPRAASTYIALVAKGYTVTGYQPSPEDLRRAALKSGISLTDGNLPEPPESTNESNKPTDPQETGSSLPSKETNNEPIKGGAGQFSGDKTEEGYKSDVKEYQAPNSFTSNTDEDPISALVRESERMNMERREAEFRKEFEEYDLDPQHKYDPNDLDEEDYYNMDHYNGVNDNMTQDPIPLDDFNNNRKVTLDEKGRIGSHVTREEIDNYPTFMLMEFATKGGGRLCDAMEEKIMHDPTILFDYCAHIVIPGEARDGISDAQREKKFDKILMSDKYAEHYINILNKNGFDTTELEEEYQPQPTI